MTKVNTPAVLIGLSGLAGAGKDTVRNILQDMGYTGFAFADPIRGMLRELVTSSGIDDKFMDDRALKESIIPELGVSYRHMAQTLGTEWGRSLAPDFWLRIADAYMGEQIDLGGTHFCVSDVRFANEAQWVRDYGGVVWHITRPDCQPVRPHVSEDQARYWVVDHQIHNDGSIGDLHRAVVRALDEAQELPRLAYPKAGAA